MTEIPDLRDKADSWPTSFTEEAVLARKSDTSQPRTRSGGVATGPTWCRGSGSSSGPASRRNGREPTVAATKPSRTPYLHVRPVYRTGETPRSEIKGNRAGLLQLRDQIDRALEAERNAEARYREADERVFVPWVSRAKARWMMGEPRALERGLLERAAYP